MHPVGIAGDEETIMAKPSDVRRLIRAVCSIALFCGGGLAGSCGREPMRAEPLAAQPSESSQKVAADTDQAAQDLTDGLDKMRGQPEAVEHLLEAGGELYYDYQVVDGDHIDPNRRPTDSGKTDDRSGKQSVHNVVAIDVRGSQVTDKLLANVSSFPKLRWLVLRGTEISDAGLEKLGSLESLRSLTLDGSPVTDAGLVHVLKLKGLQILGLAYTGVTDSGLEKLTPLTQLEVLDLKGTGITDRGLERIKLLANVRRLGLRYCKVTDSGLAQLKNMPHLEYIDLWYTEVTPDGIQELKRALPAIDIPYTGNDPSQRVHKQ